VKYGVISDVHSNLHALEAVVRVLEDEGVDRFICAGDLVGYGPRPNECVERIASLRRPASVIAGNHDLMAIGRLPSDGIAPLAKETIEWTSEVLAEEARNYLEALPESEITDHGVAVAHGSLDDPVEYVFDGTAARKQLIAVADRHPEARALVLGHTHIQRAFGPDGDWRTDGELSLGHERWLLNAGSVGQSRERDALARALVLDLARRSARFLAVEYDLHATKRELRAAGLPEHACHLAPGRAARVRRKLRAALPGPPI
jgi:predicted phosphodiesterase